ncbi:MAG: GNAT family N-acetyltransferase [Polyangiaceae bacterium]|jgi:GNAT superfamily N-acetyltransferase|nr:GNAT family N-acetyltransferase [Polyangiaceae bacterium]
MTRIEPARPDDHPSFAALFPELETGEAVPDAARFAREIAPTALFARDERMEALGYVFFQIYGRDAYVRHLVTAPRARRGGVGRALMAAVAQRARAQGASAWRLNVKVTNETAIRFYQGLGLRRAFETWVLRLRWRALEAAESAISAWAPTPEQLPLLERAFDLPAGLVTKSEGKVLAAAWDGDEPSAFGSFDPTFPGVYPLRATRPDAALAVLRTFSSRAQPLDDVDRPWRSVGVQVVVEDAEPTARALLELGADEVFRIAHLRGDLPTRVEQ